MFRHDNKRRVLERLSVTCLEKGHRFFSKGLSESAERANVRKQLDFGCAAVANGATGNTRRRMHFTSGPVIHSLLIVVAVLGLVCWRVFGVWAVSRDSSALPTTLAAANSAWEALRRAPEADALFRSGRYDAAEALYMDILEHLPDPRHGATLGTLMGLDGSSTYRRIVAGVYSNLGLSRLRKRAYEAAVATFREALGVDPSTEVAGYNLGIALLHLKRFEEAVRELERARASRRDDSRLYLHLGEAYLGTGDDAGARWALSRAVWLAAHRPTDVQSWGTRLEAETQLATAYERIGRLAEAERHLLAVLGRAPGDAQARYRLMLLLARAGRVEEAETEARLFRESASIVADIQAVLARDPGEVAALAWIADTYRRLGLLHLAEVHYEQLLVRTPGDATVRAALNDLRRRLRP